MVLNTLTLHPKNGFSASCTHLHLKTCPLHPTYTHTTPISSYFTFQILKYIRKVTTPQYTNLTLKQFLGIPHTTTPSLYTPLTLILHPQAVTFHTKHSKYTRRVNASQTITLVLNTLCTLKPFPSILHTTTPHNLHSTSNLLSYYTNKQFTLHPKNLQYT